MAIGHRVCDSSEETRDKMYLYRKQVSNLPPSFQELSLSPAVLILQRELLCSMASDSLNNMSGGWCCWFIKIVLKISCDLKIWIMFGIIAWKSIYIAENKRRARFMFHRGAKTMSCSFDTIFVCYFGRIALNICLGRLPWIVLSKPIQAHSTHPPPFPPPPNDRPSIYCLWWPISNTQRRLEHWDNYGKVYGRMRFGGAPRQF